MNPFHDYVRNETRRQFFSRGSNAVGWAALAALLGREGLAPPPTAAGLERRRRAPRAGRDCTSPPRPSR